MKRAVAGDTTSKIPERISNDEMLTLKEVCAFFGGAKPINPATLYRGVRRGYFPKPIHITDKIRRWSKKDCEVALQRAKGAYRTVQSKEDIR